FPNSVEEMALASYEIIRAGGFDTGGFNFDTKLRRQSIDPEDLFHGHIGGMDTIALAWCKAAELVEKKVLSDFVEQRYAGWTGELGKKILQGGIKLDELSRYAVDNEIAPKHVSGKQELLENKINAVLYSNK